MDGFYYDIDWTALLSNETWDWIYFWVRDPDFVSMKAVEMDDCPTGEWPYEYVNGGPKYSICQDFGFVYEEVHGIRGSNVTMAVFYESGAPATPTSGPTVTPPFPATPTPPSGH